MREIIPQVEAQGTPGPRVEMSKSRKARPKDGPPTAVTGGRRFPRSAAALLVVAVVVGGVFWWSRNRPADSPAAVVPPAATPATSSPTAPLAPAPPALQKLAGRWMRTDGGYVVEIRSVEPGGKVDAAYFNPRPIHVARAEASPQGGTVRFFMELRDVNYPGSTYDLRYDPGRDVLEGTYFQAVERQLYDVSFVRR